jgi:hypothetical protein
MLTSDGTCPTFSTTSTGLSGSYNCRGNIVVFIPSAVVTSGSKIFVFNGMKNPMYREPPPSPAVDNNPIKIYVLADRVYENVQSCNFGSGTTSIFTLATAPTINDPPTPTLIPNFYGSLANINFEVVVSNTIPAGGDLVITMPGVAPWTTNPYSVIV